MRPTNTLMKLVTVYQLKKKVMHVVMEPKPWVDFLTLPQMASRSLFNTQLMKMVSYHKARISQLPHLYQKKF